MVKNKLYKNSGTHGLGPPKLYKNSGTHELGPPKHYKNNGTHDPGAIFLEPESCILLFLDEITGKNVFFHPNRKFLEKMPLSDPLMGGTTAGPKKVKIYN